MLGELGEKVSRKEALDISRKILLKAETNRKPDRTDDVHFINPSFCWCDLCKSIWAEELEKYIKSNN